MSISRIVKLGFATLLALPLLVSAEEKKPTTLAEAKAAFAKADKALNEAWAEVKKALEEEDFAALQFKQRRWVQYRDDRAKGEDRRMSEAEAKRNPEYYETAAEMTASRADWLRGRIKNATDPLLTGLWTDSFGGEIEVVQEGQRLAFIIRVVRGPTFHTGSVAGIANWNAPLGWFSDKGRDKDKAEETNVAFVQRGFVLEIVGANTSYYHGARAYFDGEYCKVEELDERRKAAVIRMAEAGAMEEGE